jgi:hypothetical protein
VTPYELLWGDTEPGRAIEELATLVPGDLLRWHTQNFKGFAIVAAVLPDRYLILFAGSRPAKWYPREEGMAFKPRAVGIVRKVERDESKGAGGEARSAPRRGRW